MIPDRSISQTGQHHRQFTIRDNATSQIIQPIQRGQLPRQVRLPDRSDAQTGETPRPGEFPRQVSFLDLPAYPTRAVIRGQGIRQSTRRNTRQNTYDKPPYDSKTAMSLDDLIHNALCMDMHRSTLVILSNLRACG